MRGARKVPSLHFSSSMTRAISVHAAVDGSSGGVGCRPHVAPRPTNYPKNPHAVKALPLHKTSYERAKEWLSMLRPAPSPTPYIQCRLWFLEYRIHISLSLPLLLSTGSPQASSKSVSEPVGWGNIGCIQPQRNSREIVLHGWNAYA